MTTEQKQEFTRRITQANSTQLIIILYDITITYLNDATKACEAEDFAGFEREIIHAGNCIAEMIRNLHFAYAPAKELHAIYLSMRKSLREALTEKKPDSLMPVIHNLTTLRDAYRQIAPQDTSGPVMGNTQTVIAGLTYGKNTINENLADESSNRGFRV